MYTENLPLVSIGIPTYNRPDSLNRMLECIVNQTYPNLEIIISDNCSADEQVQAVIKKYAKRDPRIVNIRQAVNKGMLYNFKYVLDQANAEYFMWAADDDYFELNFIERCMKGFLKQDDIVLSTTSALLVDRNGVTEAVGFDFETIGLNCNERVRKTINYFLEGNGPNVHFYGIYRTNVVSAITLKDTWNKYWGVDVVMLLQLSAIGSFAHDKECLGFHYYLSGESYSKDIIKTIHFSQVWFYFLFPVNFIKAIFLMKNLSLFKKVKLLFFSIKSFRQSPKGRNWLVFINSQTRQRLKQYIKYKSLYLFKFNSTF